MMAGGTFAHDAIVQNIARHIVFVEREAMSADIDHRDGAAWRTETLTAPTDTLALPAVDFAMTLEAVHEDVFPEAETA